LVVGSNPTGATNEDSRHTVWRLLFVGIGIHSRPLSVCRPDLFICEDGPIKCS